MKKFKNEFRELVSVYVTITFLACVVTCERQVR